MTDRWRGLNFLLILSTVRDVAELGKVPTIGLGMIEFPKDARASPAIATEG